jgi:sarcosine oxidase subunit gamma
LDDPAQEAEFAKTLAVADGSFLPRVVVKGPQAAAFLRSHDIPIPDAVLKTGSLANSGLIIRTGGSEFLLEDGFGGGVVASLEQSFGRHPVPGVYFVLRQDAAIILSGEKCGSLLRQVSSYDFTAAPHHELIFTPIAGVSCSVLRQTINGLHTFRLLTDGTYGIYIWHVVLDIARELGGGAVGTGLFFPGISEREANRP